MIDSNNKDIGFYSGWDIDKLIIPQPAEISIPVGTSTVYAFTGTDMPVFDIMVKYSGRWYQSGRSGVNTAPQLSVHSFISNGTIKVTTNKAVTVRVYIWTDKVNY